MQITRTQFSLGHIDQRLIRRFKNLKSMSDFSFNKKTTAETMFREMLDAYEPVLVEKIRDTGIMEKLSEMKEIIDPEPAEDDGEKPGLLP